MSPHSPLPPPDPGSGPWALLDFAPDGMLVVGESGELVFANVQAGVLFGATPADMVGRTVEELMPPDLREGHRSHRRRYQEQPEVRAMGVGMTLRARRTDGSEFHAEISLSPFVGDGGRFVVAAVRDISDRLAAEAELHAKQLQLAEAERTLALADDRERIARDLHDTVIQRIFAAGLSLQSILRAVDEATRPRIERTIDDLDNTIRELRTTIFSLSPPAPNGGGLRGRVLDAIAEIADGGAIQTRIQFDGNVESLPAAVGDHLVPVVTEAVANAAKHGSARNVRVEVSVDDRLVVTVTDDGVGVAGEVVGGRGLANLRERASSLGGEVSLARCDAGGTRLEWSVPLPV